MQDRIVIAGYFGFGNLGDELILTSMINGLRIRMPDLSITVLSGSPQATRKTHHVESIAWDDYSGIATAISACDLVILGGGGLFHDYWGVDNNLILTSAHSGFSFYTSIAFLASFYEKKLMLSAVGVGPIFSDQGRQLMKVIASQADLITVRDLDSQQQLIDLGIPGHKISLTADAVFALSNFPPSDSTNRDEALLLGVSLRHWNVGVDPVQWQREVSICLDRFLESHPSGKVVFIPFQNTRDAFLDDYEIAKDIRGSLKHKARTSVLPRNSSIEVRLTAISKCSVMLGMRLHSIILALMSRIPVIGINYDPKVQGLLRQFSLEKYLVNISQLNSSDLYELVEENVTCCSDISTRIQNQLPDETRLVHQNFDLTIQLLQSKSKEPKNQPEFIEALSDTALALSLNFDRERQKNFNLNDTIKDLTRERDLEAHQKDVITSELESLRRAFQELKTKSEAEKQSILIQLNAQSKELRNIKSSRGWKVLFRLWELRLFFIPKNSKREALIKKISHPNLQTHNSLIQKALRWMKRRFTPKLSWPALAFRNAHFKRQQLWPQDLSKLNNDYEPGLVSIVLPVHNGEKYLGAAIQSILDQTYKHFELIIVDDGSTDRTPSITTEFEQKDQRIRVIHQTNLKLPGALNTGFEKARGEFFTWTSDDNLLTPKFIEKMVDCLRRHPHWHMVYANMDLIDENGAPLRNSGWYEGYQFPHHSEHIFLPTDPSELNIIPNNYIGSAFLYRRQVADLLAGYSPYQYTREDYDYWMQVNSLFTIRHTDFKEPIYKYRMHSTSLTSQDKSLKITEDRKFLMVFEDFRRDFYLMPLIWVFEDDQFENSMVKQIIAFLQNRGHIAISLSDFFHQILPIKWIPCIHLKICCTPEEKEAFLSAPQEYVYAVAGLVCVDQKTKLVCDFSLVNDQHQQTLSESSTDLESSLKAIDIKCRSLALRGIENQTWQPQPSKHKISVVICTYNRNAVLELSLRAIARQTVSQSEYEVIVVDNNPDYSELIPLIEQTREWEFFRYPECLRLVQCPIRGLSYARNAGISEAKGEWVLFLDDDAMAESDLLEKYLEAFENHSEAGLIGGHIQLLRPKDIDMPWKAGWERYWSHFETEFQNYTPVNNWYDFPWGANWCARRQALFQIGGFRGAYGRRGEDYSGGEEIIAASLIQKLGYSIGILPQAKVIHQVDPSRFSLMHLEKTILAGQLVRYQAELDQYLPRDLSLSYSPLKWINKFQTSLHKTDNKTDVDAQIQKLENTYLFSAKRKLMRKKLLTDCARFKFLYPLIKHLL